ncbi:MAG: putative LPS assembly protein LptD [Candidatus Kapaibacteriales bacterium]
MVLWETIPIGAQPEAHKKKISPKKLIDTATIKQLKAIDKQEDNIELDKLNADSDTISNLQGGIESTSKLNDIIKFTAADSICFTIPAKHLYMRGKAKVEFKSQKLSAEIIEFFLDSSIVRARGAKSNDDKLYGYPAFTDNKEVYYGEKISYNFRTQQGTISLAETQLGEGYYFGKKIKRVDEDVFFAEEGCFTTCNAPHPHYYFGSPKMKVIPGDRVFIDPLIFYVEDLPVFILPIGLFFPNRSGRQSGLIVPSFFFSQKRGVTIENLGLYLALSEYYDTRFSLDFYSKGGFLAKNVTQWKYRRELDGRLEVSLGRVRFSIDEPFQKTWSLALTHNHRINPFENFTTDLKFYSQDFFRQTSTDIFIRQTQDLTSNASYSRTFENGATASISYSRSQNIISGEYSESPNLSFTIPQWNPFRYARGNFEFLRNFSIQYSLRGNYFQAKRQQVTQNDTTFVFSYASKIMHSPSFSLQLPKFYYFTLTPFFSFSMNNYFRRLERTMNSTDSNLIDKVQSGFFQEFNYSLGASFTTKLYGIIKPRLLGLKAVRHMISPTIQYSYTPNLSNPKFGFYGEYFDYRQNRNVYYSRFEKDGGGLASRTLVNQLSYNLMNSFSAKYNPTDTGEDKTLDFLNINFSGGYNFSADSLRASDVLVTIFTPTIPGVNLSSSLGFTLYDQNEILDPINGKPTGIYQKVNRFLLSARKGIARLTRFNLNFSTSFAGGAIPAGTSPPEKSNDSLTLGERFQLRLNPEEEFFDFWGDKTPGTQPLTIQWNLSLDVNYSYNREYLNQTQQNLVVNVNLSLKPTKNWSFRFSAQFDALNREIISPVININRDLHCWEMTFIWYPKGFNAGYYLRIGIKSSILRDLKIEKRSSPIY